MYTGGDERQELGKVFSFSSAALTRLTDHFDEGDGRDADFFKVMRILFPSSGVELGLLGLLVVLV